MIASDKPDFRDDLSKSVDMLRNGGFIQVNTDCGTLIACDANNAESVALLQAANIGGIYDQIILLASIPRLQAYTNEVPDIVWELIEVSDKPVIIIPDGFCNLAENISPATGFRISNWPFSNYLCERFRQPLFCIESNRNKIDLKNLSTIDTQKTYVVKHRNTGQASIPSILKIGKGGVFQIIRK